VDVYSALSPHVLQHEEIRPRLAAGFFALEILTSHLQI
jgi:hypothetical protein